MKVSAGRTKGQERYPEDDVSSSFLDKVIVITDT